jgi:hypothetical protein
MVDSVYHDVYKSIREEISPDKNKIECYAGTEIEADHVPLIPFKNSQCKAR